MNLRKSILPAALLLCAGAFGQTTSTTHTRTTSFGVVGFGSTETMRVNLLNIATASTSGTAASCTGTVTFTSATGATIGAATAFTIASGQVFSVNLSFASSGGTGSRVELVPSVQQTSSSAPCGLSASLEVFDASSGVSHIHLGSSDAGSPGFGR
jgi:hypothetical protein